MTLNPNKLFMSTAVVFAFLWIICSALIAVAPAMMLAATGFMIHAELQTFTWSLTPVGVIGGLVLWSLIPGLTIWLIATVYNRTI